MDSEDKALEKLRPRFGRRDRSDHAMPRNVSRAFHGASGYDHPRIWTAGRDPEVWRALATGGQSGEIAR